MPHQSSQWKLPPHFPTRPASHHNHECHHYLLLGVCGGQRHRRSAAALRACKVWWKYLLVIIPLSACWLHEVTCTVGRVSKKWHCTGPLGRLLLGHREKRITQGPIEPEATPTPTPTPTVTPSSKNCWVDLVLFVIPRAFDEAAIDAANTWSRSSAPKVLVVYIVLQEREGDAAFAARHGIQTLLVPETNRSMVEVLEMVENYCPGAVVALTTEHVELGAPEDFMAYYTVLLTYSWPQDLPWTGVSAALRPQDPQLGRHIFWLWHTRRSVVPAAVPPACVDAPPVSEARLWGLTFSPNRCHVADLRGRLGLRTTALDGPASSRTGCVNQLSAFHPDTHRTVSDGRFGQRTVLPQCLSEGCQASCQRDVCFRKPAAPQPPNVRMHGPPTLEELVRQRHTLDNRVILTFADFSFVTYLWNFVCNLAKLEVANYVIAALDPSTLQWGVSRQLPVFLWSTGELPVAGASARYRRITQIKLLVTADLIALGYGVLVIDPDVVLFRNPLELVTQDDVMFVQSNSELKGGPAVAPDHFTAGSPAKGRSPNEAACTGMYFVPPTFAAYVVFRKALDALSSDYGHSDWTEQLAFSWVLCEGPHSQRKVCDSCARLVLVRRSE